MANSLLEVIIKKKLGGNNETNNSYITINQLSSNQGNGSYRFSTTNQAELTYHAGPLSLFDGLNTYSSNNYFYTFSSNNTESVIVNLKINSIHFKNRSDTAPNNRVDFRFLIDKNKSVTDSLDEKSHYIGLSIIDISEIYQLTLAQLFRVRKH